MPVNKINDVNLYWELTGSAGEPLVLVHGSWGDHHNWDGVVNEFSKTFRVLTYDRRGHSKSERLNVQGNADEDVSDLIELVEYMGLAPAHIAGNSFGAAVVLKAAARKPDLFKTMIVHEPPLFGLLKDVSAAQPVLKILNSRIEAVMNLIGEKRNEDAARLFVETIAFGPGAWQQLPLQTQQTFTYNAPTFYDEILDEGGLQIDTSGLRHFNKPALLTNGTQSPPFFPLVVDELIKVLPHAKRMVFEGAGHVPHLSHSEIYIDTVKTFYLSNTISSANKRNT